MRRDVLARSAAGPGGGTIRWSSALRTSSGSPRRSWPPAREQVEHHVRDRRGQRGALDLGAAVELRARCSAWKSGLPSPSRITISPSSDEVGDRQRSQRARDLRDSDRSGRGPSDSAASPDRRRRTPSMRNPSYLSSNTQSSDENAASAVSHSIGRHLRGRQRAPRCAEPGELDHQLAVARRARARARRSSGPTARSRRIAARHRRGTAARARRAS